MVAYGPRGCTANLYKRTKLLLDGRVSWPLSSWTMPQIHDKSISAVTGVTPRLPFDWTGVLPCRPGSVIPHESVRGVERRAFSPAHLGS